MNYYDLVLAGIGIIMLIGFASVMLFGAQAVIVSSLLAVTMVGHALFFNPPRDPTADTGRQKSRRLP
jgi:hypothetical protein